MTASRQRPAAAPAPSRLRVRRLTALALAAPLLVACSSVNFNAPTDQVYTPAQGVNEREGTVDVLNALIVSESNGTGRLIAGLSNNGDEEVELTSVQGEGDSAEVQFSSQGGETAVGPGGFLQLADEGSAFVVATGEQVVLGDYVRLTMTFSNGEDVEVNVPVVAVTEDFADVELPPSTGSTGSTESPSESPSESPTESADDSGTEEE